MQQYRTSLIYPGFYDARPDGMGKMINGSDKDTWNIKGVWAANVGTGALMFFLPDFALSAVTFGSTLSLTPVACIAPLPKPGGSA